MPHILISFFSLLTAALPFAQAGQTKQRSLCAARLSTVARYIEFVEPSVSKSARVERGVQMHSVAQVQKVLKLKGLPEQLRADLTQLKPEHFESDVMFYLDSSGLSRWDLFDYANWTFFQNEELAILKTPKMIDDTFWRILRSQDPIPGIDDENLVDLRLSLANARLAADLLRQQGLSPQLQEVMFDDEYDQVVLAGAEDKIEFPGLRISLPLEFDAVRNDFEVSTANALHVLTVAGRFQKMRNLVTFDKNGVMLPALSTHQLYFASTFPELLPHLARRDKTDFSDENLRFPSFVRPDDMFSVHYHLGAGVVRPYMIHSTLIKEKIPSLGIAGLRNSAYLRRLLTQDEKLGPLDVHMEMTAYGEDGEARNLSQADLDKLSTQLNAWLARFPNFSGMSVRLRPSSHPNTDPHFERPPLYQLQLIGANVSIFDQLNFFMLFDELADLEVQ